MSETTLETTVPAERYVYDDNYPYLVEQSDRIKSLGHRVNYAMRTHLEYLRPLNLPEGARVLDVGCCMGILGHYMHKIGHLNVTGVDINFSALKKGYAAFPEYSIDSADRNTRLYQAEATFLPFQDRHFDGITSQDLLEHLPDEHSLEQAFSEMVRVLKGSRMVHKITVIEDTNAINNDPSHFIKKPADWWKKWFYNQGWDCITPTSRRVIRRWKRCKILPKLDSVHGYFLLRKRQRQNY